jgi:inhibitor of KinA sporulation pathway (predicted exonuclease)
MDIINVIDLEATCWEGEPPEGQHKEIIEIGICPVDTKTGSLLTPGSYPVIPQMSKISPFCTKLTGWTEEELNHKGDYFRNTLPTLATAYGIRKCGWASWGEYDRIQFEKNCELYQIHYPFKPSGHINVKFLFAMLMGEDRVCGVSEALYTLGMTFEGIPHTGKDDAYNIARILSFLLTTFRKGRVNVGTA